MLSHRFACPTRSPNVRTWKTRLRTLPELIPTTTYQPSGQAADIVKPQREP
ncbi:MAG: hypothetical protein KME60_24130 [Cyanomargarita calcarea GSE-NOS-MK-12-04C]|uniref:Uncharacterized protein n=1 Tax=Cyanomargarita calcarea GSE-NOS-MK-12-04C TaxID=2839659 RepID=A0A951QST3_9CYAN|nr:hypothetical protein [Cyanomargarita calcarea GSE-NOS-MK-12-04C]